MTLALVLGCVQTPATRLSPPTAPPSVGQVTLVRPDPSQLFDGLFERVQMTGIFSDSKYFVDMIGTESPEQILQSYRRSTLKTSAELRAFVDRHFLPPHEAAKVTALPNEPIDKHIQRLWKVLRREPKDETNSSLIALPYAYIVPGGRFREIYYWDSYFTQLGLLADHEDKLFQDMVRNFSYLIFAFGRIPNGNRDYYLSRSQPPFFSYMIALWRERFGDLSAVQFLPALRREYEFWMNGSGDAKVGEAHFRAVRFEEGCLNRYWDDRPQPRPEAYREDKALAQNLTVTSQRPEDEVYRDLRAAAESGWDFSTRWFADSRSLGTIQTTSLVPVDLNALLYHLELEISELAKINGETEEAARFERLALVRQQMIQKYLWEERTGTFRDYNWRTKSLSPEVTVAMAVPLFAGVASQVQADRVAHLLGTEFLKAGGLVTSTHVSGQQWDAPNGWPPHQWMAYAGLKRYHADTLAERLRARWLRLNQNVYQRTGKMMEKYNVIDLHLKSGGGEYPLQDGFGWTNGVFRALSVPQSSLRHISR